ncbi:MAG: sulfotransferase [Bacillota bacterium]
MNDVAARGVQAPAEHSPPASAGGDTRVKVIYIAGDGRSGSTLLDRLIGAYPGVFSCGELGNLLQSANSDEEYCACTLKAGECGFWRGVMREWSATVPRFSQGEYRRLQHRYERLRALFLPFNGLSYRGRKFSRYAEYTLALFSTIARLSGASIIVDSSKNPARALALSRVAGLDLRLLHLVRDVRGVAYSLRIPYRERPKDGPFANVKRRSNLRFAGTWALVNYFCERVRRQLHGPSLFLRYEDYTRNPDVALSGVADLLGVPRIDYAAGAGHLLKQGHQIAGNDLRLKPVQKIAPDESWRSYFSFIMQKGLYLLVLPLMLRYRYRP